MLKPSAVLKIGLWKCEELKNTPRHTHTHTHACTCTVSDPLLNCRWAQLTWISNHISLQTLGGTRSQPTTLNQITELHVHSFHDSDMDMYLSEPHIIGTSMVAVGTSKLKHTYMHILVPFQTPHLQKTNFVCVCVCMCVYICIFTN